MADLALPQETSWKLLAVSPDMMDTHFCNKRYPFRWRSSLAISAFEPDPATMPTKLCEGRITFLKVTATITGYQPSELETKLGFASFPDVPTEELVRIIGQYFACYGVLLNVAVFPHKSGLIPSRTNLANFPHIIGVEPKTRELIQASTETGEILTTSKSNIKTNKALNQTKSSETGFELSGMYGKKDEYNASAKLDHKRTEEEQNNWSVATDASRERQETQGSSTEVSQLYNLLSSYHIGTNRAQFLMLARPHTLQPTDHRTFVSGLRQIEGIQDFILIVARPPDMDGLCVEATLETGHFPENLVAEPPPVHYEERFEDFKVVAHADDGLFSGGSANIDATHDVESGWVVDTRASRGPDPGHEGMKEIANDSNGQANESLTGYNYRRISDATVSVTGRISGEAGWQDTADFDRTYRVFTRSVEPKTVGGEPHVPIENLLITSRSLCVCFNSSTPCPVVDEPLAIPPHDGEFSQIVAEVPISINGGVFPRDKDSKAPAAKALLSEVGRAMTTNWRLPLRHARGEAPGFLESDYFKNQIKQHLSRDRLDRKVGDIPDLKGKTLGEFGNARLGDVLDLDFVQAARHSGLELADIVKLRRSILGVAQEVPAAAD